MKLRMPEMPPANLLAALGSYNLLPAIIFLPTRRRCDEAEVMTQRDVARGHGRTLRVAQVDGIHHREKRVREYLVAISPAAIVIGVATPSRQRGVERLNSLALPSFCGKSIARVPSTTM